MPGFRCLMPVLLACLLWLPVSVQALQKGEFPPPLSGTTLDGQAFDLEHSRGRPILLKVGTTWCPSCGEQTEEINKIRAFIDQHDIAYIEVFVQESEKKVRSFFTRANHRPPEQVVLDQGAIARALNIYVIPRLILIDSGYRVFRDGDPLASTALKQELEQMLTEK